VDYYVYLVECADGSFYCGITLNLEKRLKQHNGIVKGGAVYTKTRRPVFLRYYEKMENRSNALKREYEIKSLSHYEKSKL
jgi:putative endonuclease